MTVTVKRAKAIGLFERETWMLSWQLNRTLLGLLLNFPSWPLFLYEQGLEAHDSDPSEAWTSSMLEI
jgi:hypothetical protein